MDKVLYGVFVLLSAVFNVVSHVPWIGFIFYFVGLRHAVVGRFNVLWFVFFANLCFFSPNIAVLIQRQLYFLSEKILR